MKFLKYGLGIDIAMEKFDACLSIIDQQQHVTARAQCSFKNDKRGFEKFIAWVNKNTRELEIPVVYLMEATGIYYEQLAWLLHLKNVSVSVVLPNKAKKSKDALGLKSKNDRIDARGLAQMACEQSFTVWKPLSDNLYILRLVTRQIQSIAEQTTVLKNQLHALRYGMYRDKDIEKILELLPANANFYFTNAHIPRALSHEALQKKTANIGLVGESFDEVNDALKAATSNAMETDVIIVCGSFFIIAELDPNLFPGN